MAKKSTAARQANAARRPQTTAKSAAVTLVRTPKTTDEAPQPVAKAAAPTPARAVAPSARPKPLEAPKGAKPAPPRVENTPAKQPTAKAQAARVARARAAQRARAANLISPTHYSYVLNDLKLIVTLAVLMFTVIIILHFALPS